MKVAQWLRTVGNPYQVIAIDEIGMSTVPFSIKGIPETFVISKDGVVRFHTNNPLTDDAVNNIILPLINSLNTK